MIHKCVNKKNKKKAEKDNRNVGMMRIAVRRITNCVKKNDEKNSD